jgi:hypothetical protein
MAQFTVQDLKRHFHRGRVLPYTWPGSYPKVFICEGGRALCARCLHLNRERIFRSTHETAADGWAIDRVDVNFNDAALHCEHCGERIESAWAEAELPKQ